jgi:hypothetical protein
MSGDQPLLLLALQRIVFGDGDRMVFRCLAGLPAGWQALDQRVVIGVMKEDNGEPSIASQRFRRRIHDSVQGRNPVIIRPPCHEIPLVDDEGICNQRNVVPLTLTICDL